jgi:signal transduction histidine kinase
LLDVEELEEGLLIAEPIEANVAEFCEHAARHHGATIKMRNLSLEFHVDPALTARLDVDLVGRLVENLLDNAVRYAPRKGRVVVTGEREADTLVLRVGNEGPPVPEAERARIFERYYRIDARRSGARANRGLGLYFCKLVAEAHGGSIAVESLPELPACFAVYLPQ